TRPPAALVQSLQTLWPPKCHSIMPRKRAVPCSPGVHWKSCGEPDSLVSASAVHRSALRTLQRAFFAAYCVGAVSIPLTSILSTRTLIYWQPTLEVSYGPCRRSSQRTAYLLE